ncbi:MAG: Ig-like domain-containing protein [Terriglobia bacterium]|nr:Ig-like domain-containing protein [Terriglobia bacterium]
MCSCEGFFVSPQITSITVTPPSPSMVTGAVLQFNAVATYEDGATKVLSECVWTSSNTSILLVNKTGIGTAISAGSATLTATYDVGIGSTTVTINESPLVALRITPINPSVSLAQTTTQQFAAIATFGDGSERDITNSVSWTSSNTVVATVSSTGLATAKTVGTAIIKITSGTITDSTTLTVMP